MELPGAGYRERTRKNVLDSDGTLVIHFGAICGGTLETVQLCGRFGKPMLIIDGDTTDPKATALQTTTFLAANSIKILNVAGPREHQRPGAHAYAEAVIRDLLDTMSAVE